MKITKNAVIRSFAAIGIAAVCVVGLIAVGVAAVFLSLPDANELKGCMTTKMYKVHLCETDPNYVKLDQISPNIIGAVIMSEDAAFYSHEGIDYDEVKESAIKDFNEGRFARGASTISQQLVKNVFLSSEKSLMRKATEIYLTMQIEKIFTKSKILEKYLNVVEFAPEVYGVFNASKFYFNTTPGNIRPEQGAFLAFLLPNPKKHGQSFKKKALTPYASKTIKTILHKMLMGHKISEEEYTGAIARMDQFPWQGGEPVVANPDPVAAAALGTPADPKAEVPTDDATTEDDGFQFEFEEPND